MELVLERELEGSPEQQLRFVTATAPHEQGRLAVQRLHQRLAQLQLLGYGERLLEVRHGLVVAGAEEEEAAQLPGDRRHVGVGLGSLQCGEHGLELLDRPCDPAALEVGLCDDQVHARSRAYRRAR